MGSPSRRISPASGVTRAGERLDQAGLAGAVVADDGQDLAGQQVEVGAVERGDVAVALDQAAGLQHGRGEDVAVIGPSSGRAGRRSRRGSPGCR